MNILLTFTEGLISFVSPCMLPLLPVYAVYFAAGEAGKGLMFMRAFSFVAGFTVVFTLLGVFAGTLGAALAAHRTAVDTVCGLAVMAFGLGYLGLFRLPFSGVKGDRKPDGVFSAFLFGLVYSVNLTPCVGAFLGAALMQAAAEGGAAKGAVLLLAYSLGLGVPFTVCAVLLNRFSSLFGFVKRNYRIVNPVCGVMLVLFGAWMIAAPRLNAAEKSVASAPVTADSTETIKEKAMAITITSANFEAEVLKSDKPVLVDFWAPWCGPCRMLGPLVEQLAAEKGGTLKVCKVNVDEAADLAAKYGITGIPALLLFKDGKVAATSVGYIDKDALARFAAQ
jgi:cytochrome c-type biogenesis protein